LTVAFKPICSRHRWPVRHYAMADGKSLNQPNRRNRPEIDDRPVAVLSGADIGEAPVEPLDVASAGISRHRSSSPEATRSQIVDPVTMLRVIMPPQHGIDPVDVIIEELLAHVRGCVDQYPPAFVAFDEDGNACPPISRLIGIALAPVISDPRHSGRSARPEDYDPHEAA